MHRLLAATALTMLTACGGGATMGGVGAPRIEVSPSSQSIDTISGEAAPEVVLDHNHSSDLNLGRSVDYTPMDSDFVGLLNNARLQTGAGTLSWDARLDRSAQAHADDMAQNDYFSHVDGNGNTSWERAIAAGYNPRFVAENLLKGSDDVGFVFQAWQDSPSHRRNQLDVRAEDFGIGVSGTGYDTRWVLVLGAPLD